MTEKRSFTDEEVGDDHGVHSAGASTATASVSRPAVITRQQFSSQQTTTQSSSSKTTSSDGATRTIITRTTTTTSTGTRSDSDAVNVEKKVATREISERKRKESASVTDITSANEGIELDEFGYAIAVGSSKEISEDIRSLETSVYGHVASHVGAGSRTMEEIARMDSLRQQQRELQSTQTGTNGTESVARLNGALENEDSSMESAADATYDYTVQEEEAQRSPILTTSSSTVSFTHVTANVPRLRPPGGGLISEPSSFDLMPPITSIHDLATSSFGDFDDEHTFEDGPERHPLFSSAAGAHYYSGHNAGISGGDHSVDIGQYQSPMTARDNTGKLSSDMATSPSSQGATATMSGTESDVSVLPWAIKQNSSSRRFNSNDSNNNNSKPSESALQSHPRVEFLTATTLSDSTLATGGSYGVFSSSEDDTPRKVTLTETSDDDVVVTDAIPNPVGTATLPLSGTPSPIKAPESSSSPAELAATVATDDDVKTRVFPNPTPGPWEESTPDTEGGTNVEQLGQSPNRIPVHQAFLPHTSTNSTLRSRAATVLPEQQQPKSVLLDDYTKAAAASAATATIQNEPKPVTLPANISNAPVLQGQYVLPALKTVEEYHLKHGTPSHLLKKLLYNVWTLVGFLFVTHRSEYKLLAKTLVRLGLPAKVFWIEYVVILGTLGNVAECIYHYTKATNMFEKLPLTADQRSLLGLDPVVSSVPGAIPVFKNLPGTQKDSATKAPVTSINWTRSTVGGKASVGPVTGLMMGSDANSLTARQRLSLYSNGSASTAGSAGMSPGVLNVSSHTGVGGINGTGITDGVFGRSTGIAWNRSLHHYSTAPQPINDREDLAVLMRSVRARDEEAERVPGGVASGNITRFGQSQDGAAAAAAAAATASAAATGSVAAAGASGPLFSPSYRYQQASRTTMSKDQTSKTELLSGKLPHWSSAKVLKTIKVSEFLLDRWVINMRKWMWTNILQVLIQDMDQVDAELASHGLSYLDCKSATMFYTAGPPKPAADTASGAGSTAGGAAATPAPTPAPAVNTLGWGAASVATQRLPSVFGLATQQPQQPQLPQSLPDLEQRARDQPVVRRRMVLEMYLAIPGVSNRKYVVERIHAMGHPLLSNYIWDSANVLYDQGKKKWSPDLPTDSQIMMHLFTVYMDLAMPQENDTAYGRFPFSFRHFVPVESVPDANISLQIKQVTKVPKPSYQLVVSGVVWDLGPANRLNLWYTLVLFVFVVMKEHSGYLGQLNINSRAVQLGDVVEGFE